MKIYLSYHYIVILIPLIFSACNKEPQPTKADIKNSLLSDLPSFVKISSFSIDAMQNLGTQVEPVWNARFHATVKTTADTYTPDGEVPGIIFVLPVKRDGDPSEIFGKSITRLYAGKWRTSIEFEGSPISALGMPESAFSHGKVIVRGSKSETDYHADLAHKQKQAIAASAREAEAIRLAQERANESRRKMLSDASKLIVGSWRYEGSVVTYGADGSKFDRLDNGTTHNCRWKIDGDTLVNTIIYGVGDEEEYRYQIIEITKEVITARDNKNNNVWRATRTK